MPPNAAFQPTDVRKTPSVFRSPIDAPMGQAMVKYPVGLMLVVALVVGPASPAAAFSDDPWEFDGGGWGHGVGLSQYGSQGMALEGKTAEWIIGYYYSGAEVKGLTDVGAEEWLFEPEAIWVGLASNKSTKTFEAVGGGIEVCLAGDGSDGCDTADLTLKDGQKLTVSTKQIDGVLRCEVSVDGGDPVKGDCWLDLTWEEDPGNRGVITGGIEYARGSMHVRPNHHVEADADAFHVLVSVGLEKYIYGIAETLLHWEAETLQTQAIIARSYGVRKALDAADGTGVLEDSSKDKCWCHIGSTSLDQNYDGWSGGLSTEGDPDFGDEWRQAVDDTQHQIVTHSDIDDGTTIISTFYSSSNGGASENVENVWGGSPWPHLKSVDDPWSANPDLNPLAQWTILVDDADMAAHFGWDRVLDATILEGPPGVLVEFTGKDDGEFVTRTLNGTEIATLLKQHGYRADGVRVRVSPYILAVSDPPGFDDIVGHLFEADIEWAADVGITKGCNPPDNTLFCPDDYVTRGQMAAFLNRYLDLAPASKDYFDDDDDSIFEDDINRLAEAGITKGCGERRFCPDGVVTRGQMAAFLVRGFGLTDDGGGDLFIDDDDSIFEHDIDVLGTAGITKGCNPPDNDKYCPDMAVTRGAMTAFLHRAPSP